MKKLPEEYRAEPGWRSRAARDGLDHTRTILREAHRHLNPGGLLVVEIGHNRKALETGVPEAAVRVAGDERRARHSCSRCAREDLAA